jgi:ribonuclease T1
MVSRRLFRGVFVALLLVGGPLHAEQSADPQALAEFASHLGLRDTGAFVGTVQALRATGHLPERYVTKEAAQARGWHGGGLCTLWPGHVIGGDLFRNFAGALPDGGRVYHEADLDSSCAQRGPKRLVFSNDGAIYVTVDHYNTYEKVP